MSRFRAARVAALFLLSACLLILNTGTRIPVAMSTAAGPSQSSFIALTADNSKLINVNSDVNTVTIFSTGAIPPLKIAEIPVGVDPSSVAVNPSSAKAYVTNAYSGTVSVIDLSANTVSKTITVGVEPMGVAVSPNGTRVYVANSVSNSVSVIDASTESVIATIDLSAFGTAPRAVAVTNNGDVSDTDETVLVALFFGQLRVGKTNADEGQDDQREGRVIAISAGTNTVLGAANLAPIANTGFNSNGQLAPATGLTPAVPSTNPQSFSTPTGAYPNQLASIAINPATARAYVVSTAASPNGPSRFNQMAQGLVSLFIIATRTEVTAAQTDPNVRRTAPLNMNQGVNLGTTPAPRLFLTNPVAMAWTPNGANAWVAIQNSDLLVRLTADASGIPTVSSPVVAGPSSLVRVDLQSVVANIPGKAPRGVVIDSTGTRAYVSNFVSRSVTVVDISAPTSPSILGTALSTPLPDPGSEEETVQLGEELFYSGRGPNTRMSSESWGSCAVCHPQGRSDNVTWMFDSGPRQTIPLDGTFADGEQRILNWSAVRDEVHDFELNTRNVFGGRGLIDDDRLFIAIGGTSGATPTDSALIEQFHQFTGAVSTTNDLAASASLPFLPLGLRDFATATTPDGRIFIFGGRQGSGNGTLVTGANAVLEFNPRANTLVPRGTFGFTPRHSLGAAAVKTNQGTRIYAIGGYASTSPAQAPSGVVEEYNPATDTWRTVASLPTAVAQFGITAAGGINTAEPLQLIHVVSGNAGTESAPSVTGGGSIVQRFQPDPVGLGTWSAFSVTGLTARRNHGAAAVLRGVQSRIFVIGGQDAAGTVLSTVEEYAAQAVVAIGPTTPAGAPFFGPHPARTSLPSPRARFGLGGSLSTSQIYVMGGIDGTGADQTSVFEYTAANNGGTAGNAGTPTGAWVTRGNISLARHGLAVSTPPPVTNLEPLASAGRDARQDAISLFVSRRIRSTRAPLSSASAAATAGKSLFNTVGLPVAGFSCASCHPAPRFTASKVSYVAPPSAEVGLGLGSERVIGAELRQTALQNPGFPSVGISPGVLANVGTFIATGRENEIRSNPADISQAIAPLGAIGFNMPSLLSIAETAPYFYSGLAQTLTNVLDGSQDGNGGTQFHFISNTTERAQLVAYLQSIEPDNALPDVVIDPTSASGCDGSTATFTAFATGIPTPGLQWQQSTNGGASFTSIPNETSPVLIIPVTFGLNGIRYRAEFRNFLGVADSAQAVLNVTPPITVVSFPVSKTVDEGAVVTFSATTNASPPASAQWQVSTDGGATFANITGATASTYSFSTLATDNGHRFRALFSRSGCQSVATSAATLTVRPFTDSALVAIKAIHLAELRPKIEEQRVRFGLGTFPYTNASLTANMPVSSTDLSETREALRQAYVAAGRPVPIYTDPTIDNTIRVKAAHIYELRLALVRLE